MSRRVSVTELQTYMDCGGKWWLSTQLKLPTPGPLLSGAAIHAGVSAVMRGDADVEGAVRAEIASRVSSLDEEGGLKYLPGALRAITAFSKLDAEILAADWEIEPELSAPLDDAIVVGHPDLLRVEDGISHILELKSTSKDPASRLTGYERWSMQGRCYAVLLGGSVWLRYVVVSTDGRVAVGEERPILSPERAEAKRWMQQVLGQMAQGFGWRSGEHCWGCSFSDVCTVRLTGGDLRDKIETLRYEQS